MNITKPLLAEQADLAKLKFPVLASPKLDGVRGLVIDRDGKDVRCPVTRKFKDIPNDFVRAWMKENIPLGMDGEFLLRNPIAPFEEVTSAIMSKDGEPDFVFAAFDFVFRGMAGTPFTTRFDNLKGWAKMKQAELLKKGAHFEVVPHKLIDNMEDLMLFHKDWIDRGFEGTMVRDPQGPYKFGRSTVNQGILLKIKEFMDEEATVTGIVEQMQNCNELTRDDVGGAKRSAKKSGKKGKGTMGALICKFDDGTEFQVGTGFTDELRQKIWDLYEPVSGEDFKPPSDFVRVKVKHQVTREGRLPGKAPRFPTFLGFRHPHD